MTLTRHLLIAGIFMYTALADAQDPPKLAALGQPTCIKLEAIRKVYLAQETKNMDVKIVQPLPNSSL